MTNNDLNIRELKYNQDGTIDLVMDHPIHGAIPFTASPNDPEGYGELIFNKAKDGIYGPVLPYTK